jgi:predicted NAD/FAD-dependent oxidoreductase
VQSKISKVEYSTRYALGLFFHNPIILKENEEPIHFVNDPSTPIRYWSIEGIKRSGTKDIQAPAAVIAHTSVEYGAQKLAENANVDLVRSQLLHDMLLQIRPFEKSLPSAAKIHRWRYSQVRA